MKVVIVVFFMMMFLLVVVFFWFWVKMMMFEFVLRFVVSIIVIDDLFKGYLIFGVICFDFEVLLVFQILGWLSRWLVDIGDVVEKDQFLVVLDFEDLQDEVCVV